MMIVFLQEFVQCNAALTLLVGLAAYITIRALCNAWSIYRKGPPGPTGLPILGYYPFILRDPVLGIRKVSERYEGMFQINLLGEKYYFLNSMDAVKDMAARGASTAGRPTDKFNVLTLTCGAKNILSADGEWWTKHHQFLLGNLASQGVGKIVFEDKVHALCEILLAGIRKVEGTKTDFKLQIVNFTSNIMSQLLFSKTHTTEDPVFMVLQKNVEEFFWFLPNLDSFLVGPIFQLFFLVRGQNYWRLKSLGKRTIAFWKPMIEERLKIIDEHTAVDMLDCYVCEHKKEKQTTGANTYFGVDVIAFNLFTIYTAGTEATSNEMYHAINLMVLYPKVQTKVQEEIDEKIGKRRIYMSDKSVLNYTTAVLAEILRYTCLAPLAFSRRNFEVIEVCGYKIPAKSNLVVNIWKLSRDPAYFKNPHEFDPTNFLDENGHFVKREANIQFSCGKRMCPGFAVADTAMFICFTSLMQKFLWESPEGEIVQRQIFEGLNRVLFNFSVVAYKRV